MRRGVIVKALKCCAESNCGDCPLEQLREGCRRQSPSTLTVASAQTHTQTLALQTGRLSSQRRQSRSLARGSFSGRAERESCLRTRSKPAPDGTCISTP